MGKKQIVICDDEEGVRESLNLILGDDYNLAFTRDGKETLTYLKHHNPDVVIMDIKMPYKNGIEILKELRKDKPDLKVIIVTGYQSVETARETVKYGICEYITKPFDGSRIKEAVRKAIQ